MPDYDLSRLSNRSYGRLNIWFRLWRPECWDRGLWYSATDQMVGVRQRSNGKSLILRVRMVGKDTQWFKRSTGNGLGMSSRMAIGRLTN